MRLRLGGLAIIAGLVNFGVATAQPRTVHDIPLPLAVEATAAAVADCAAKGFSVSAALVDRAGILRALHRADNAGPHTVDASRRKAFTALTLKIGTLQFAEILKNNPGSADVIYIADILVLGGGVPIKIGDEVVGAIGVGGSPSAVVDAQCAEAGIARIADRLK